MQDMHPTLRDGTKSYQVTVDKVAKSRLDNVNKESIKNNSEMGGLVYDLKGKVDSTNPVSAKCETSTSGCSVNPWDAKGLVPDGAKIVADYHTHGAPGRSDFNMFSPDDINGSNYDFFNLVNYGNGTSYIGSYLGAPNGKVLFYKAASLPDNPSWDAIYKNVREVK